MIGQGARRLVLAVQFLTHLPTPQVRDFREEDLTRSAVFHPAVGALVGLVVLAPVWALAGGGAAAAGVEPRPWLAAVLALTLWVWVTGALHLDGLADVADALGAAHRRPERFLEVLRDPHLGVFGGATLVVQLLLKLVLLAELAGSVAAWAVVLVPVWARWGTLWWSGRLPPIRDAGMAERFSWQLGMGAVWGWGVLLTMLSAWLAPVLLLAVLLVPLVARFWRRRLGGISGDCLGAGIEAVETLLLLALALAAVFQGLEPGLR